MTYFKTLDGRHVVLLEPAEIKRMMLGARTITPDAEVVVAYTPDAEWTEAQMQAIWNTKTELTPDAFTAILTQGMARKAIDR